MGGSRGPTPPDVGNQVLLQVQRRVLTHYPVKDSKVDGVVKVDSQTLLGVGKGPEQRGLPPRHGRRFTTPESRSICRGDPRVWM